MITSPQSCRNLVFPGLLRALLRRGCVWDVDALGLCYTRWTLPDQRDDHSDSQPLLCDSFLVTEKRL